MSRGDYLVAAFCLGQLAMLAEVIAIEKLFQRPLDLPHRPPSAKRTSPAPSPSAARSASASPSSSSLSGAQMPAPQ